MKFVYKSNYKHLNITSFESWAFSPEFKRKSSLTALFAIETFADRLHPVYAKPKSLVITKNGKKKIDLQSLCFTVTEILHVSLTLGSL